MKKIVVNQKKCIGCGTCTVLASKNFKLNKNGKAQVISQTGGGKKEVSDAIVRCPVRAISYKD